MSTSNDVTISLSILLGIASVTLGVCSLVNASRCDRIDVLWGCVKFERTKATQQHCDKQQVHEHSDKQQVHEHSDNSNRDDVLETV